MSYLEGNRLLHPLASTGRQPIELASLYAVFKLTPNKEVQSLVISYLNSGFEGVCAAANALSVMRKAGTILDNMTRSVDGGSSAASLTFEEGGNYVCHKPESCANCPIATGFALYLSE